MLPRSARKQAMAQGDGSQKPMSATIGHVGGHQWVDGYQNQDKDISYKPEIEGPASTQVASKAKKPLP